jgi:hypothetical protein
MKEEDGNWNRTEDGERNMCCFFYLCVFKFSSFTTIITELLVEVNLGYQFDWLLEIVIFLVAVDKV